MKNNQKIFSSLMKSLAMKQILLAIAILVVVPIFVFSQTKNTKQKGNDEQAVRQAMGKIIKAVESNDIAALERLYADGFVFTTDSGIFQTRAERLGAMKSGKLKYESVSFDDLKVQMFGNTAVATLRVTSKFNADGQSQSGKYRVTGTFVKNKGHWQEVAAQVTPIVEQ